MDGDNEKENLNPKRRAKTKSIQYEKIDSTLKDQDEEKIGKKKFNELWDQLSVQLNSLGPPTYTAAEWRKVWSKYKYAKKLSTSERSDSTSSQADEPCIQSTISESLGDSSQAGNATSIHTPNIIVVQDVTYDSVHMEISSKLDTIIAYQQKALEGQQKTNELLQQILDKDISL